MIYPFECWTCETLIEVDSRPLQPPSAPMCCGRAARRIFGCAINTASCRDHSDIPEAKRVVRSDLVTGLSTVDSAREERRFAEHIRRRRADLVGKQHGTFRHTHSVPADLYHGKIRETADKRYWDDQKNVRRHKDCEVS